MKIFTLGYQGLNLETYVATLVAANVGCVLDVREKPWSQRPDFIKSNLRFALEAAGVGYVHVQSAGNPSAIRKAATSVEACLRDYRKHLRANCDGVEELYSFSRLGSERGRPVCLTCYERDPAQCHRSVLLDFLRELEPALVVTHLPLPPPAEQRRANPVFDTISGLGKTSFLHPRRLPFT